MTNLPVDPILPKPQKVPLHFNWHHWHPNWLDWKVIFSNSTSLSRGVEDTVFQGESRLIMIINLFEKCLGFHWNLISTSVKMNNLPKLFLFESLPVLIKWSTFKLLGKIGKTEDQEYGWKIWCQQKRNEVDFSIEKKLPFRDIPIYPFNSWPAV